MTGLLYGESVVRQQYYKGRIMTEKILFIDDDPNILDAFKRQLRKQFKIETAPGGDTGIKLITSGGPFAVVVSDLRMPGMDGVQFLTKVRSLAPECVRIMLTGQADMNSAAAAVNEGNIFRFLTKPCNADTLIKTLNASLAQYRLITAERELLEKTLRGSVKVLTDIMSLTNPTAFSRIPHIKRYVRHIAARLQLKDAWRFEIAAMLSQIGSVVVSPDVLQKVYTGQSLSTKEQEMFSSHPSVGYSLLSNIPRLEPIAMMIKGQQKSISEYSLNDLKGKDTIVMGSQILKVALDFDQLLIRGIKPEDALAEMFKSGSYNQSFLVALENIADTRIDMELKNITIAKLETGMIADEDIKTRNGVLLLSKGQEITPTVLKRLLNIANRSQVAEPFRVLVRTS